MSPYDIVPSANPRIPVNLEFFLTNDYHIEKVKKKVVQTYTDGLIGDGRVKIVKTQPKGGVGFEEVEYIPEQLYIPKKTGIDAFTQVENDELFNFEREVEPIIQVLITKTIEQSLLELEEEVELMNMEKFKNDYINRELNKKTEDKNKIVTVETDNKIELDDKIKKLEEIQTSEEAMVKKAACNIIAHNYLRDLENNVIANLENRGRYRPQKVDQFSTGFMSYITGEIVSFLTEEFEIEETTKKLFPDIEANFKAKRKEKEVKILQERQEMNRLAEYKKGNNRKLYVYWENLEARRPLVFSSFNSLILENKYSQELDLMLTKYEDIFGRFERGNLGEDEYNEILKNEMPNPGEHMENFSLPPECKLLNFAFANNPNLNLMKAER